MTYIDEGGVTMRITAKGRYGLAAMIHIAQQKDGECVPVIHISEKLDISKIYLEQVFALLKRGGLVSSIKGSQGGYQLIGAAKDITVYEIMKATELAVFEETKATVEAQAPEIDKTMSLKIFAPLDQAVKIMLQSVSLQTLVDEAENQLDNEGYMFFI